jgi:hypothetical protein
MALTPASRSPTGMKRERRTRPRWRGRPRRHQRRRRGPVSGPARRSGGAASRVWWPGGRAGRAKIPLPPARGDDTSRATRSGVAELRCARDTRVEKAVEQVTSRLGRSGAAGHAAVHQVRVVLGRCVRPHASGNPRSSANRTATACRSAPGTARACCHRRGAARIARRDLVVAAGLDGVRLHERPVEVEHGDDRRTARHRPRSASFSWKRPQWSTTVLRSACSSRLIAGSR